MDELSISRFCRSGAVEKVRHKRRECANAPASRADMRVDGPCARWGDRVRLVGRACADAVALVGRGGFLACRFLGPADGGRLKGQIWGSPEKPVLQMIDPR